MDKYEQTLAGTSAVQPPTRPDGAEVYVYVDEQALADTQTGAGEVDPVQRYLAARQMRLREAQANLLYAIKTSERYAVIREAHDTVRRIGAEIDDIERALDAEVTS